MSATLGSAYVQIVPSAKGISGSIQGVLDPESKKAGTTAGGKIASFAKVAIVGAAIGKAFSASILEGGALEQSIGGVETLFKDSADTIIAYADNAYKTAGISANDYMETATGFAASLLQSLGGDTELAAQYTDMAITDMADNANKFGTDMESIQYAYQGFAKQNYTMLDNLKLGYGGTRSEMERLLADAEKITGVKYDINNLSDVYEAIHVIQGELGITGATAAEAEKTILGSFNSMKAAAQNFMGNLALGRNINESMTALVESASTFLFGNLLPAVGRIIVSLPPAIFSALKSGIPKLMEGGKTLIEGLIDGVEGTKPKMIKKGSEAVLNFVLGILKKLPEVIVSAGELIVKLINTIDKKLPMMQENGTKLLGKLAIGFVKAFPKIMAAMGEITVKIVWALLKVAPKLLSTGLRLMGELATGIRTAIANKISGAMSKVKDAILTPIRNAKNNIKGMVDQIKGFFNFTLKFKGVKMPHIKVSWNKKGAMAYIAKKMGLPGVPDFNVNWYKKGGIFNDPAIIGLGEAGTEAVVPLDQMWDRFDMMADSIVNGVASVLMGTAAGGNGDITLQVYMYPSGPKMGEHIVNTYDTYKKRMG